MRGLIAVLALTFLLFPSAALAADEVGEGSIEGLIVNGTVGYSETGGLRVTLKQYRDGAEIEPAAATTSDADGLFSFTGLARDAEYAYQVSVLYQDVEYTGHPVVFEEGQAKVVADVLVYEATNDPGVITVPTSHIILYPEGDRLLIKEFYLLLNTSDRTFVGMSGQTEDGTLLFSLPEGVADFEITLGLLESQIVFNDTGFKDTTAVMPGDRAVSFSYITDFSGGRRELSRTVYYPTANFDLLIQGPDHSIESDQLNQGEPMEISGSIFDHLYGAMIPAGEPLSYSVKNKQGGTGGLGNLWIYIFLAALAGSVVAFYLVRRRGARAVPVEAEYDKEDVESLKDSLLSRLAGLDDDFEQGIIAEEEYREQRGALKSRLSRLL